MTYVCMGVQVGCNTLSQQEVVTGNLARGCGADPWHNLWQWLGEGGSCRSAMLNDSGGRLNIVDSTTTPGICSAACVELMALINDATYS